MIAISSPSENDSSSGSSSSSNHSHIAHFEFPCSKGTAAYVQLGDETVSVCTQVTASGSHATYHFNLGATTGFCSWIPIASGDNTSTIRWATPANISWSFVEETCGKESQVDSVLAITSRQAGPNGSHSIMSWPAFISNGTLFLKVPDANTIQSGTAMAFKDSVVTVLELAEDMLGCDNLVVCLERSREDMASLLRSFMFVGFEVVHPSIYDLGKRYVLVGQSLH